MREIDIIAEQAGVVIFIEVKARSDHEFGHPFDALTPTKQKKIVQTAPKLPGSKKNRGQTYAIRCGGPDIGPSWFLEKLNCSKMLFRFEHPHLVPEKLRERHFLGPKTYEETRLKGWLANSEENSPQNLQLFGNSSIFMKNRALLLYQQNNRLG